MIDGQPMIERADELLPLDTLALARRGREEQARVIAELASAALSKLGQAVRKAARRISTGVADAASPHMNEGLKGN